MPLVRIDLTQRKQFEESRIPMPRYQIVPFDVDAASPDLWAALHVYRRAITAELHPDEPVLSDAECEYEMRRSNPLWEVRRWLAIDRADIAGSAATFFRRAGTPNAEDHARFVRGFGDVRADARRQGIGTLLLQQIHALMHALDKSVLTLSAHTGAGHGFLTHAGAAAKNSSVESRARLAGIDWACLRAWERAALDLGLVFECYAGRVPRDMLVSLLPAFTALSSDLPLGELETAPIRIEIESYDRWYESMERTEAAHHLVLLRDQDGAVVAMSEASWDNRNPKTAYQAFTAVARPWRGRGLARAVKGAVLRQIRSFHPGVEDMRTNNAESNAAMLSVNRQLGFTALRRDVDYQITRAALDTGLQRKHHIHVAISDSPV
jgi:GNAT superfamily N-acetyltransferase